MYVVRAGVRESWKSEVAKAVVGGVAAATGFGISEFTAEYVVNAAGIYDAIQKLFAKMAVRVGLGLVFLGISWVAGGILSWIFLAMSMGSVGGIALDIFEYFGISPKSAAASLAFGAKSPSFTYTPASTAPLVVPFREVESQQSQPKVIPTLAVAPAPEAGVSWGWG